MPVDPTLTKSVESKPSNLSDSYAAGAADNFFLGVISASPFIVTPRYRVWLKSIEFVDDASPIVVLNIPPVVEACSVSSNIEEPPVDTVYILNLIV